MTEGMAHVDFTSYALVEGRREMLGYWPAPTPAGVEGHRAVAGYVARFFAAYLAQDAASRELLSRPAEAEGTRMSLEHRPASPRSITYDEFVSAVVAGRAEEAVGELRAAAAVDPDHVLLGRTYLERLTQYLLFPWNLAEEALPVIEFMNELYPESMLGRYLVGEAHVLRGDYATAIDVYERHVEEYPDDANAKARLESLRNRVTEAHPKFSQIPSTQ